MNGQVALVTGAAAGIGYGLAQALLKRGVKICVADINAAEGERAVQKFNTSYGKEKAVFQRCDVTSPRDIKDAYLKVKSTFGQLDIVCNNAGVYGPDDSMWEHIVDINLKSTIRSTRLAIEHMRKDMGGQGGTILNIASVAGFVPRPECPSYCATKAAVISYTRSMAMSKTLQKNGLKFVALCPAYVDTPLFHRARSDIEKMPNGEAILEVLNKDVLSLDELIDQAKVLFDDDVKSGEVLVYSKLQGHHFMKFD